MQLTQVQRLVLGGGLAFVLLADVFLAGKVEDVRIENATLRSRMALSLDEQFAVQEHEAEGRPARTLFQAFRRTNQRYAAWDSRGTLRLILYFPHEHSVRGSLHRELAMLQEMRPVLAHDGIKVALVFGQAVEEGSFEDMVRTAGRKGDAFLDREGLFERYLGPRLDVIALVLGPNDDIIYAHFERTSDDGGVQAIYGRLDAVASAIGDG